MSEGCDGSSSQPKATWAQFLADWPPCSCVEITDDLGQWVGYFACSLPSIKLHCSSAHCNGNMFFAPEKGSEVILVGGEHQNQYATYRCRNCSSELKTYAFMTVYYQKLKTCLAYKLGEFPEFGPPIPSKVISLIGPDKDLFLRGRRCENQGLGVGAFTYYRCVVERQRNRLIDEIIAVSKALKAPNEYIELMSKARTEKLFSRSLDMLKGAVPEALSIDGHNPLSLLHRALSGNIHESNDADCLSLAKAIRVVLFDLVEKMAHILKDRTELKGALSELLKSQSERRQGTDPALPKPSKDAEK